MENINKLVENQKAFFLTGKSLNINYRIKMLKKLKNEISINEQAISNALKKDLGKSHTESYMCEIGLTLSEITHQLKHIKKWSRPKHYSTPFSNFPGKSFSIREPYGCVLIMSPWNYPFLLCMEPLIGAIAAGNCCIIKPSAYSPFTSSIISEIISKVFPPEYVSVVQGGRSENNALLKQPFDYIFFTGSVNVGKQVMEMAALNLTPVTLELGGKSPCIIDKDCNIKIATKRVVFGKFLNCGQTCVAPDYILVHNSIKDDFIKELNESIKTLYGDNPLDNPDYGKIINEKHFNRLLQLIEQDKVISGGTYDAKRLKIAPTLMDNVTEKDPVMQEEIFGPIMPIISYDNINEASRFINGRQKPLALYIFSNDKKVQEHFLKHVSFGGGCINDTIMHLATSNLPFGGVGNSGMGSYHGIHSFNTFTHEKAIVKKYFYMDVPLRYQPYTKFKNKLIKVFLK